MIGSDRHVRFVGDNRLLALRVEQRSIGGRRRVNIVHRHTPLLRRKSATGIVMTSTMTCAWDAQSYSWELKAIVM